MALVGPTAIVTPVYVEFMCGVRDAHELRLARAFLAAFPILDQGRILRDDWEEALRRAQRIPADGRPRDFADCLIRAIAKRFHCEVLTQDLRFDR